MPEPLNPGSDEDSWLQDAELIMQATLDKVEVSDKKTSAKEKKASLEKSSTTVNKESTSDSEPTSAITEMAFPPFFKISSRTELASFSFDLEFITTDAPLEANRIAVAFPMLRPEPVTKAILSFSGRLSGMVGTYYI